MAAVFDDRVETVSVIVLAVVHETSCGRVVRSKEIRSGGEPASLVELGVGREVDLRHDAFDAPVTQNDGTVVETASETDRGSDHDGDVLASGEVLYLSDSLFRLGQQKVLSEEVKAGVTGYR